VIDVAGWLRSLERQLALLRLQELNYQNLIRPPASVEVVRRFVEFAGLGAGDEMVRFYEACDGLAMMGVHVGYDIQPLEHMFCLDPEGFEPRRLKSDLGAAIVAFGSDGGGSRFARAANGGVLFLSSSGAVRQGTYDDLRAPTVLLAASFGGFLERLLQDVQHYVAGDYRWPFMAR
jgi:hypothetical protein